MLKLRRTVAAFVAAALMTGTLSAFAAGPNPAEEAEEPVETAALAAPESTEAPAIRLEEIHTADGGVAVDVIIDNTPYLVTADVEIGLQNAELGAVTSMPGGHVVCERDGEGYLLRWRRTNGDNAAESTTIIATVGIANGNAGALITATCKDCRVTDAAIATEVAGSELRLQATPELEVLGMGSGLNHHLTVAVHSIPTGTTEVSINVHFDSSKVEQVDVRNENLGSGDFSDDGNDIILTVNDLEHNGNTVKPIALDFQLKVAEEVTILTTGYTVHESGAVATMAPVTFTLPAMPTLTPTLEVSGMGGGLNHEFDIWPADFAPADVESIVISAELPEGLHLSEVSAHGNRQVLINSYDDRFDATITLPEGMGVVEPVRMSIHAALAGTYQVTIRGVINYRAGNTAELSTSVTVFATPIVEMWEFYDTTATAIVHGMTKEELEGLTACLATYSPTGQMLTVRMARVEYTEAVTGPCGRVQFKLTQACEMQEGNSQRLFFLDSACRPILPATEVPNGTMHGVHLGPGAYQPAA